MLQKTKGIVLRTVKYGDSSLVTTLFTAKFGVESYLVRGVRSRSAHNKAGFFQPGMLLELVIFHQPNKNLQRISEFQAAYLYTHLQENVIKNSIVMFSVEVLLRLLPEQAPLPELFDFSLNYFISLDTIQVHDAGNFPVYFILRCAGFLGFDLLGEFGPQTPHLNLQEGGFTGHPPAVFPFTKDEDALALSQLMRSTDLNTLKDTYMNADMRLRLIDWYIAFLQCHSQHMGSIKSLAVLRMILH